MSDQDAKFDSPSNDKIDPNDPSLDLVPQIRFSNKSLKIVFILLGSLIFIGFMFSLFPQTNRKLKDEEEENLKAKNESPSFLNINEGDYYQEPEDLIIKADERNEAIDGIEDNPYLDSAPDDYVKYEREDSRPSEIMVKPKETAPLPSFQAPEALLARADQELELMKQINSAPMFYSEKLPSSGYDENKYGVNAGTVNNEYELMAESLALQSESDYEKQNYQRQKNEWLASRSNDFSNYLESSWTAPMAGNKEIKAGTIIPIVMITGISSDLPGQISAQVIANIYDSLTGTKLLIPKGTKVVGSYDSSVAFGQDRILLAWDRMIRPDGVSLNLRGMQGAGLQGFSGMEGDVDNHFLEMMASVGIGSAFDLAMDSVVSALSSINILKGLSKSFDDNASPAQEAVGALIDKMINQQPTIEVLAGARGTIFVNKDMVLPHYDEYFFE